ncbi:DUF2254 domain-containing protein [Bacillus sp. 2205SS5-2]|uniref:DUF2254 domain-containing protein n=1 Tax=Bacillus sp. 2205SS5-2 TaxID=3109031 RepID=UPI003007D8C7
MRTFISVIKNSLWFVPSIYSFVGLILAIITIAVDTYFINELTDVVPNLFFTRVDLASTILATLSSALLTMTTFTFSIIMIVLTTYSSQFSPRALPNFMTERTTMRMLGVFLGGFLYSICSLLFMRSGTEDELVISAVIGVFLTIICLVFFIHFIHHIGRSIQVDFLIEKLTKESLQTSKDIQEKMKNLQFTITKQYDQVYLYKKSFFSSETVYFQHLDIDKLRLYAKENKLFIEMHQKIGEFLTSHSQVFTIHTRDEPITDDMVLQVYDFLTLSHNRSTSQDISFSIQKLVEIALRATSPAINDPFTAKHCIRNIGMVLGEFAPLLEGDLLFQDEEEYTLLLPFETMRNLLYFSFNQFQMTTRDDLSVLGAILDALITTAHKSSHENKQVIWSYYSYVTYNVAPLDRLHELDQEFLMIKKKMLFDATR